MRGLLAGLAVGAAVGGLAMSAFDRWQSQPTVVDNLTSQPTSPRFVPRSASDAPTDAYGDAVRRGEKLMTDTRTLAPRYAGNDLVCSNCHLDAGRKTGAAPLWAAFVNFPAFRTKNGEINSFQKRVQDCFVYSLNGTPPPLGSPELLAIESYAAFMARGLPSGMSPPGRGFPKIAAPPQPGDDARGVLVFTEKCSACHGADGAGQRVGNTIYPPLWGARSFNWGAGMATIDKAAAFIHANMPLGQEGSLSVQQAWDVAAYIDGKVRPQDPRFDGSAQSTRLRHHASPYSRYGTIVAGHLLGDSTTTPLPGSRNNQRTN